ncbi:MAG: fibrobacter succinogenes major paralogous domain-containing protein [Bacteroidales bacterium]
MKTRIQHLRNMGFIRRIIPFVLITILFSVSFHSCQKDESILSANTEADVIQSGQFKSATNSNDFIVALILKIENYVTSGDLEPGIANALISKLENAIKSLEKGNEQAANNQLQAVVRQLESLVGNGNIDSEVGEEIIFDTKVIAGENPTFIDTRDGNEYQTILIGGQVWMAENLAYATETGSWAYDDDENNVAIYGRLYNWNTALTACPNGWHIPTTEEWIELKTFLVDNGYTYDESCIECIAKSLAATTNWDDYFDIGTPGNDILSNNSCGFSGLPAGRYGAGEFNYIGRWCTWWSATEVSVVANTMSLFYSQKTFFFTSGAKELGYSVRCIKD